MKGKGKGKEENSVNIPNKENNESIQVHIDSKPSNTDKGKLPQGIYLDPTEDILFTSIAAENIVPTEEIRVEEHLPNDSVDLEIEQSESVLQHIEQTEIKHSEENYNKHMDQPSEHIITTVHEEIFEFDLSDPITEPVSVDGNIEDAYADDSIEKNSFQPPHSAETVETHAEESSVDSILEQVIEIESGLNDSDSIKVPRSSLPDTEPGELHIDNKDTQIQDTKGHSYDIEAGIQAELNHQTEDTSVMDKEEKGVDEAELKIEIGEHLHNLEKKADKIDQIVLREEGLNVEVDISKEHIILINNSQDYIKYQHSIMDNRCVSFFWPCNGSFLIGSRVSVSTEKGKTFILDLDKLDISLLNVFMNAQRPIKVLFNTKSVAAWCKANNLNISHIFDISTAVNLITDGKYEDNSVETLISRYSGTKPEDNNLGLHDFVFIGKFILELRKKLVDCFQTLGTMDILNLEQKLLFALAQSEVNGMPYNQAAPNPLAQGIWELVESKYGVTSKKELAKAGILSLNKSYLSERKDLLEINEYIAAENSERIRSHFDEKYVSDNRVLSTLESGPMAGIITKGYSFDGEGLYSFISSSEDSCLVEGRFKDLEIRIIAKLLNNSKLLKAFNSKEGPYAYFSSPLFEKNLEDVTLDDMFIAKMILEMVVRELGDRETLNYGWNIYQVFMKVDEIIALKEKFKKAHPDLIELIRKTREQAQKDGYITTSTGRISIVKSESKAFQTKVEMYMNDIFKRALALTFDDLEAYNADFSPKIKLCTIYNRIITLECDKNIVNIAIDMLTRNMTRAASKILRGMPVLLKVYGTEQWEA